jgi:hypothetical protein
MTDSAAAKPGHNLLLHFNLFSEDILINHETGKKRHRGDGERGEMQLYLEMEYSGKIWATVHNNLKILFGKVGN